MKVKALLFAVAASFMLMASVSAATLTSSDGVISIETPDDSWKQVSDSNHWFAASNGKNTVTIDHFSNGEQLPEIKVADSSNAIVCEAYVSSRNEVFVVKGLGSDNQDMETLMRIIGTVKVLKFDTKQAVSSGSSEKPAAEKPAAEKPAAETAPAKTEDNEKPYPVGDPIPVFDEDGIQWGFIYEYSDASFRDQDGNKVEYLRNGVYYNGSENLYTSRHFDDATDGDDKPYQLNDGFTCYDSAGRVQGMLRPFSDGLYYSNDMMAYVDNGDGSYYCSAVGEYLYDYNPMTEVPSDAYESDGSDEEHDGSYYGERSPEEMAEDAEYYGYDLDDEQDGSYYGERTAEEMAEDEEW